MVQTQENNSPDLSIVIEWENILLSEDERCFTMLKRLAEQLEQVNHTSEVLVIFNPEQFDRGHIEVVLQKYFQPGNHGNLTELRLEEAQGSHYYELKNQGAARAHGNIVIFIDSDIIPEPNWLKEISQPFFDNPEIEVIAGHTYLCHDSMVEKAFALGWFFPLRNPGDTIHRDSGHFFANNVAFRRDVIQKNPFPDMPQGVARGDCTSRLSRILASFNISIWTNTAARAQHPPPTDFWHYTVRALAHGRDYLITHADEYGKSLISSFDDTGYYFAKKILTTFRQIKDGYKSINLPIWQIPAIFFIMTYFYTLACLGSFITVLFPEYARKHWQI